MSDSHGEDHEQTPAAGEPMRPAAPPPPPPSSGGPAWMRSPLVLGGAAVVIVAAIVGAYFLGSSSHNAGSGSATTAGSGASAQNLSDRGVCEATLDRVRNYGIVEQTTQLTSQDAQKTSVTNRVVCTAKNGDVTYKITVDQLCSDMGNDDCLKLWSVTDSSGKSLFQHSEFMPPDDQ